MLKKYAMLWTIFLLPTIAAASLSYDFSADSQGGTAVLSSDVSGGADSVVISGVPSYLWRHGCGPTAAGMLIGYWDMHGFSKLILGDSSTQTAAVNQVIASDQHYQDYSLPKDSYPNLLADKSQTGGAHADNCLADFMKTSWSSRGNYYGWGYLSDLAGGLDYYTAYVNQTYGSAYTSYTSIEYLVSSIYNPFSWSKLVYSINHNKPLVFLVDSNGDGDTDHFVPAIGYRTSNGYQEYACYDTWDTDIRWEKFLPMANGQPWGIYSAVSFNISLTTIPGDANEDYVVDVLDLGILATNYGTTDLATWAMGDFNDDFKIDVIDLGILATHYGAGGGADSMLAAGGSSVPEPACFLLMLTSALLSCRRTKS